MRLLVTKILFILLVPVVVFGQEKIVIDLKVPLLSTTDLAAAQAGATIYLMRSDWATVSEVGEDVTVWLTDYDRHINLIKQQVISLTLEIREPATLRTGNLIQKERITVRYWNKTGELEKYEREFLNDLSSLSNDLKVEAYNLGKKIASRLHSILEA